MSKLHPSQKFEFTRIHRSELIHADYNPRRISDRNKKALAESLKKNGLILPLIWNKRTGNIVGGHQRLERLDAISRSKDYELDVAVVDMDEKDEVRANIALNNISTMGEFDLDTIKKLSIDLDLDLQKDLLFDRDDLLVSFGMDLDDLNVQVQDANTDPEALQAIRDRKKKVREQYNQKARQEGNRFSEGPTGAVTLVFENQDQKEAFLRSVDVQKDANVIHAGEILDLTAIPSAPQNEIETFGLSFVLENEEHARWLDLKHELSCTSDKALLLKLMMDSTRLRQH